jgi:hypothetical protein
MRPECGSVRWADRERAARLVTRSAAANSASSLRQSGRRASSLTSPTTIASPTATGANNRTSERREPRDTATRSPTSSASPIEGR